MNESSSSPIYNDAILSLIQVLSNVIDTFSTSLVDAAAIGDHTQVEFLLGKGVNPNRHDHRGWLPLIEAADKGHLAVVKRLLRAPANYNGRQLNSGTTPLICAAFNGHVAIVRCLIAHGANFHLSKSDGMTPLIAAVAGKHAAIVEELVSNGANANQAQNDGLCPIIRAAFDGDISIVKCLILNGADINQAQANGLSALIAAAGKGHRDATALLISNGANVDHQQADGLSALMGAADGGYHNVTILLLNALASVDLVNIKGDSALIMAASAGHSIVVEQLIKGGANANATNHEGYTSLILSASQGHQIVVDRLIEAGANVNAMSLHGATPLLLAVTSGHLEIVSLLLANGAAVNQVSSNESTPLIAAALAGHIEIGKTLIAAGAGIDGPAKGIHAPLAFALSEGHFDFVRLLMSKGADGSKAAHIVGLGQGASKAEVADAIERHMLLQKQIIPPKRANQKKIPDATTPSTSTSKSEAHAMTGDLPIEALNNLIGLHDVKNEIQTLTNFIRLQKIRQARGSTVPKPTLHLVFSGNPGTGKTTVARIVAEIYRELGVLSKGHIVETDRSGLVAEFMGQTAHRVQEIVQRSLGGVLFIDEAYNLIQSGYHGGDAYGKEAVTTLLKLMEDHRGDLVIIVAGYTDLMDTFINSNPGLQSRFTRYLHFADYSESELTKIFEQFALKSDYVLEDKARDSLLALFTSLYDSRDEKFGNGRLARNLFERTIENHANRLAAQAQIADADFNLLRVEDIPIQNAID